ncbi:hypothetical protein D3C76_1677600 [compost metagenome]
MIVASSSGAGIAMDSSGAIFAMTLSHCAPSPRADNGRLITGNCAGTPLLEVSQAAASPSSRPTNSKRASACLST